MHQNKLFGSRVRIYSFLLTVFVIWIHAVQPSVVYPEGSPFSSLWITAQRILGTNLGQIAVPGFFVISGYLFFRGMGEQEKELHFLKSFFAAKWKKRAKSLLLPYLIWNLIYYLIYLAAGRADLSAGTILESIFLYRYNPVFWYLKQLIILTVLSPLVWLLVHQKKAVLPALILLFLSAVFYDLFPIHIVNEDAFLYYALGAAAAFQIKETVEADHIKSTGSLKNKWLWCFLVTFFLYIILQLLGSRATLFGLLHPTVAAAIGCRIFGLISLWALLVIMRTKEATPVYMEYNFFTYATHYLVLRAVQHAAAFAGESALLSLSLYILMPAICIAVSVCTGRFLQQHAPRLFSLLVGGRT